MKIKTYVTIATFLIAVSISGCSGIPEGMSKDTYDTGMKALEIMDKYNDADITADEADQRLDRLYERLDNLELSDEPSGKYGYGLSEEDYNLNVQTTITLFQYDLFSGGDTYTTADELREMLDLN